MSSKVKLKTGEESLNIPKEFVQKFVVSMSARLEAAIKRKGWPNTCLAQLEEAIQLSNFYLCVKLLLL